jgi:hypothetical protein
MAARVFAVDHDRGCAQLPCGPVTAGGLGKPTLRAIISGTVPFTIDPIATTEIWGTYECQRCNAGIQLLAGYPPTPESTPSGMLSSVWVSTATKSPSRSLLRNSRSVME